jgi:hypothetical protein
MATRIGQADGNTPYAKKGAATASSAYTLTTSYVAVPMDGGSDAVIDTGLCPSAGVIGTWVTGSSALLSIKVQFSHDGTNFADEGLPTAQASTDGIVEVYPYELTFAKADWGNAATNYISFPVECERYRYIQFLAKINATTGTPTLALAVAGGTNQ